MCRLRDITLDRLHRASLALMEALVAAHSGLRWLVLVGLVAVAVWGLIGRERNQPVWVRIVGGLFSLQVLLGVILYVLNQGWEQGGFIAIWHPIAMGAAIAVFQIGAGRSKQGGNPKTHGIATVVSLALILGGIPWFRGIF